MRWRNYLYHRYIMTHLKRNCTAPGAELSEAERKAILGAATLWQFDHGFTAPRHGFAGIALRPERLAEPIAELSGLGPGAADETDAADQLAVGLPRHRQVE